MRCRVVVPKEYRSNTANPPPNGESESVRYTVAYEAFGGIVSLFEPRNTHRNGRCPFVGSGTPYASAGARDGESDVDSQIERLLETHVSTEVHKYLVTLSSTPTAQEKMRPYFQEPTPEAAK